MSRTQNGKSHIPEPRSNDEKRQAIIDEVMAQYELVGGDDDSVAIARDEQLMAISNRFADEQASLREAVMLARGEVSMRRQAHLDKLAGMSTVMVLLVVLLFAAEAILSPQRDELEDGRAELSPVLSRLVTVRYALVAGWLMLMLAQPHWLRGIDPWFGGLLLVVVLVAGLVPLGKKT